MPSGNRLRVEMVSDVLCPWCWIGKRELELSAKRCNVDLELVLRPFMLDPSIPAGGIDKLQHYMRKFGPRAEAMVRDPNNPLNQRGRPIGLEYNYVPGCKVFNSRKAHKLLTWVGMDVSHDAQARLKEVLLRRYFKECRNLGEDGELLSAVEEAQLPIDVAKSMLMGNAPNDNVVEDELDRELAESHSRVTGVPAFYFPGGIELSGGQSGDVFDRAFERAKKTLSK